MQGRNDGTAIILDSPALAPPHPQKKSKTLTGLQIATFVRGLLPRQTQLGLGLVCLSLLKHLGQ